MNLRKLISATLVTVSALALGQNAQAVNGAGASFPAPCYQKWIAEYSKLTGHRINYQSVGSGAGLAQLIAGTVNYGASDEPLMPDVLEKDEIIQFPMLMGGIVIIVNIPGVQVGEMKLTPEILADIFLGRMKKWSDSRIRAINEGLSLPDEDITVVRRADGSGTTWTFTKYLAKVSRDWESGPGYGKEVAWPTGIGGQTNAGVAQLVKRTKFSIGYVESAYAFENNLCYTQLQNAEGKFVRPETATFKAATANADWDNAPGLYMELINRPGENSWPIMAVTYILIRKNQPNADDARKMLAFFDWAYSNGGPIAENLKFVPMPQNVVEMVREIWRKNVLSGGKQVF